MKNFFTKHKRSLYGGLATTIFAGLGAFLLGDISGYEAKSLITSSLDGINMLCNTIVLASATILALLLTLLGISSGTDSQFKKAHYEQVLTIAKFDTILFVGALMLFQLFNIPIAESDSLPTSWFAYIYWSTLFFSSVLSGLMVTVILLLYSTVINIIAIVGLDENNSLLNEDESEEDESK
ncbi:hypothetical protein [Aequorivita lipolytica]|uniref:Uncharacterized protein n=1 Tax=Aequorivita lipolytica TaxID=153267 RepID=A0A5C6YM33_9FLAO|nr:hypothetical protein [Aequorivita lipolytica]TXD68287.1 hypothetical protein ESV24_12535 [Aequorivita lipolytica]SRX53443.1 hypothetical protein AEQU2_02674 [Aequorivita lipolytica]